MNFSTVEILEITALFVGGILLIFLLVLVRRGLFRWTTTGFWAWAAFALYFVLNPLFVALTGHNLERYQVRLEIAGGTDRGLWIMVVLVAAIVIYFWTYLRVKPVSPGRTLRDSRPSVLLVFMTIIWLVFGFYSLLVYRTFQASEAVLVESGRFVGNVTAYQNFGYMFLFIPLALLLVTRNRYANAVGWLLSFAVLVFGMPLGQGRFILLSIVLLVSLAISIRSNSKWPPLWMVLVAFVLAVGLQVRGHTNITLSNISTDLSETMSEGVKRAGDVLAAQDTAMLATFYLKSYIKDTITGYDFGLPLFNYFLTGWIPSQVFPQKYFLVDWLRTQQPEYPYSIDLLLSGGKASLIGDLYNNGGITLVILGMGFLGILSRKLDALLNAESPSLAKAFALGLMSQLWIIWGSALYWGLIRIGFLAIPTFTFWILWPRHDRKRRYNSYLDISDTFTYRKNANLVVKNQNIDELN